MLKAVAERTCSSEHWAPVTIKAKTVSGDVEHHQSANDAPDTGTTRKESYGLNLLNPMSSVFETSHSLMSALNSCALKNTAHTN
jgi:hypothetical protein